MDDDHLVYQILENSIQIEVCIGLKLNRILLTPYLED